MGCSSQAQTSNEPLEGNTKLILLSVHDILGCIADKAMDKISQTMPYEVQKKVVAKDPTFMNILFLGLVLWGAAHKVKISPHGTLCTSKNPTRYHWLAQTGVSIFTSIFIQRYGILVSTLCLPP